MKTSTKLIKLINKVEDKELVKEIIDTLNNWLDELKAEMWEK